MEIGKWRAETGARNPLLNDRNAKNCRSVGIVGISITQKAPFYFAPFFASLTAIAVLQIPANAIDHAKARGLEADPSYGVPSPTRWRVLLRFRPLLVFAAVAAIFHFANAPMLPLVVQKLALANPGLETGLTSAAIIVAHLATILMVLLVTRANALGRKPLLILAFAIQILDGVGGGLFEAILPLVLADIMGGTGHYSLARGAVGAIQGIGGSSSQVVAGSIVAMVGYSAAFLSLAMVAIAGLLLIVVAMPETTPMNCEAARSQGSPFAESS